MSQQEQQGIKASPAGWRPFITSYYAHELRSVRFVSREENDRAVGVIFSDPDFTGMPLDVADGETLIVPVQAVGILREKGFLFQESELVALSSLDPAERAALQRQYGM